MCKIVLEYADLWFSNLARATVIRNPPREVSLSIGENFNISCEVVGIPTPVVVWRLNWGHVPSKCRSTSVNGVGVLFCPNIQVSPLSPRHIRNTAEHLDIDRRQTPSTAKLASPHKDCSPQEGHPDTYDWQDGREAHTGRLYPPDSCSSQASKSAVLA